ncbi:ABC transporter ATP-binding protein [Frankia sp. QA3]|uniref:ABC transporter ATP-binding protein n=1 Tax=Frankia sp. QA3 TaxID=710111 RepID=UPI000269C01D|nr:ABC transporter ATP-binding protein [Frankia sp. QA3]EIV91549.1 ABC-type branched-chain amino acid transport system, ATPase component [Frankia sp. QA3]
MTELLRTEAMSVVYGGLHAVNGLDLRVDEGRLVGLIGPNGAGKTSFIDGISGFTRTQGAIHFRGRRVDREPAHRRARLGLGRTWQSLELFEDLTVRENLQVGAERQTVGGFLLDLVRPGRQRDQTDVDWALDVLGIAHLADRLPTEISHGQRKLVGAGRTLAARPALICMDEPAAGLDTTESEQFGRRLRRIVDAGVSILLVDHDMGLVMGVCDEVYVIEFGTRIAHGTPAQVVADEKVRAAYLGTKAAS